MQRPVQPVTLIRPHAASRAARFFVEKFPGRSMYAVKANPSPDLLKVLWDSGITHYDVASIAEVRLVAQTLPEAGAVLHAPGEGRGSDRRGLFRSRRAHLLARFDGRAGEDRPRDRQR
jgi:diaminopimelate decarboxylase